MRGRNACSTSRDGHLSWWRASVWLLACALVACQSNGRDSDSPPHLEAAAGSIGSAPDPLPIQSTVKAAATVSSPPTRTLSKDAPSLRVSECAPCRFVPEPNGAFDITFRLGAAQSVERLEIKGSVGAPSQGGVAQTFEVEDAWSPTGEFLLQAIDINFDGVLDLAFGPILGTPNLELQYWIVGAGTAPWTNVGRLSNLKVRADTRELETSEKGGHAGLLFKNDVYRWTGGRLEHVRAVEQTEGTKSGQYRKTTRAFQDGKVVSESSEDVKARPE